MRSVALLAASVLVLGILVVAVGLCAHYRLGPEECRELSGGASGYCIDPNQPCAGTAKCSRVEQTYTCNMVKGDPYSRCVSGTTYQECTESFDNTNVLKCGFIYEGKWKYDNVYQVWACDTCPTKTATKAGETKPNSVSGVQCGGG
jgi:hypothetical protein